jgi:hypothetical protein
VALDYCREIALAQVIQSTPVGIGFYDLRPTETCTDSGFADCDELPDGGDHTVASHCHIDPRIFELDFDLAVSR